MLAGVIVCIVVPYLIGSLNPAIILSRKIYNDDIRSHGSGNAGTTSTLRTYGKKMAIVIFSLDLFKAAVSVIIGLMVMGTMGGAVAGIFVIVGHNVYRLHIKRIYSRVEHYRRCSSGCRIIILNLLGRILVTL